MDSPPKSSGPDQMPMAVSLIIAVYRRADFLELVLDSIETQSYRDLEIVIAEDDESESIQELVRKRSRLSPFSILHVHQPDRGFRKNRILNRAVLASRGKHLIFIDGDCILHPKFVEEHVRRARTATCLFGRRAFLSEKLTEKLLRSRSIHGVSPFSMLLTKTRHLEDGIYAPWLPSFRTFGVKGCNFSLGRELLYRINGFDEDFEKPFGGEDTDIERRLRLIDASFRCTKFKTVQYHLHHGGREGRKTAWQNEGADFYQKKVDERRALCVNGLFPQR